MFRFKFLFVVLTCFISNTCLAAWSPSPSLISQTYTFTYGSVFSSCDPTTGTFLATWADANNNQYPTYSFYITGSGWSSMNTISNSSGALITSNVITSCDPLSGKFLATWTDSVTNYPTCSVYSSGTGWSSIDVLTTSKAQTNTTNTFDSTTGKFLVTWADSNNNNYPTYALYTPGEGWSTITTITTLSKAANVYTSFDSTTNQYLAVWVDISTGHPMYSFYSSGVWSTVASISPDADVDNDVLCSCNPVTGQFVATWSDINQSFYPFYSVYSPTNGWTQIATITTTSGVSDNVTVTCNFSTGQYLAAWSNVSNGNPTYSFYTPGPGWSEPGVISDLSKTGSDVITCFDSNTGQFLATWADNSNVNLIFDPTSSFFTPIAAPPPSYFTGRVLYDRFLTQTDIIHKLMWSPPENPSSIVSYQISRNGVAIALMPASGPFVYYDHNRSKKRIDLYTIVSVNQAGQKSTPLSIEL